MHIHRQSDDRLGREADVHPSPNYDFHVTLDQAAGSLEYNYGSAAALVQAGKL